MGDFLRLSSLCRVLGLDLKEKLVEEVDRSIENVDLWLNQGLTEEHANRLAAAVQKVSDIKEERFCKLKETVSSMISYWSILSTPLEEKRDLLFVVHYAEANSQTEITEDRSLLVNFIGAVENEFHKLKQKMIDLIRKKESELKDILQSNHIVPKFCDIDMSDLCAALDKVESLILEARSQASQRKDIITGMELLESSLPEIQWLLTSGDSTEEQRGTRARILANVFPKKLRELEDKIQNTKDPEAFEFDGVDVSQRVEAVKTQYNFLVGTDAPVRIEQTRTDPMEIEAGTIDMLRVNVPRRARTTKYEVAPAAPPPPLPPSLPQVASGSQRSPSDDDYSVSSGSEYVPSDESSPSGSMSASDGRSSSGSEYVPGDD